MIHRGKIQDSIFPGSWALGKRRPGTCSRASAGTPFTRAPEPSQPGSRGPFQSPVGDSRGSQEGRSFRLKATATPGFQPGSRCPKPSHLLSPPHPCTPGKVCRGGAGGEGGGARRPARLQHARRAPHPRAQARPRSPFPFPGYFPFPPCPREEAGTAVTALGQTAVKEVIELLLRAVAI